MAEALWVQRDQFERGGIRCPACDRPLLPDRQTEYLESTTRPSPIGAALVCDNCSTSVHLWFGSAPIK